MPRYVGGFAFSENDDSKEHIGSDYIYYNAEIINNNTLDQEGQGLVLPDPQIRFQETRDKPLIKHPADYCFSIVRFSMNGANLDLPLFIPSISEQVYSSGVGVRTTYSFTLSYQQMWNVVIDGVLQSVEVTAHTSPKYMLWTPQNRNPVLAKAPPNGSVISNVNQDLGSRFWWANDYSYVLNLINETCLQSGWVALFLAFQTQWAALGSTTPCPYSTIDDFVNGVGLPPQIVWDPAGRKFTFYCDSSCFGQRLETFVNLGTEGTPSYPPYCRIFMNNNMYGLFSGFSTVNWNLSVIRATYPTSPLWLPPAPYGYLTGLSGATQELNIFNQFYQNIVDYRTSPAAGTAPLGYVPTTPLNTQKVIWYVEQDYVCVDTLWSPIGSLVFQSTLLPLVPEYSSAPLALGTGNLTNQGSGNNVAQSAFNPLVTDVCVDQGVSGADGYRHFLYYLPSAEYRLADTLGDAPISNIDISVYWKSRLTGELYPMTMFNLSSVSIKLMFRKKTALRLKSER